MTEQLHRHPYHRPRSDPKQWGNPHQDRDDWEERPREVAFWAIPLLLTMVAMTIVIIYFSMTT
jgi:hypothetical protein